MQKLIILNTYMLFPSFFHVAESLKSEISILLQ